jgi:hypothetical protein
MWWLKSCPRCGGDMNEDSDQYGHYIACIQCGHYLTEAEEVVLKYRSKSTSDRRKVAPRQAVGAGR